MPIHEVTLPDGSTGWQWGAHGAKYASREEAERQEAAARANGWTGDDAAPVAAGVICRAPDGRLLFLRRAADAHDHPETWCWPGGGIDAGETADEAAMRELREETGYTPVFTDPAPEVDRRGGFVALLLDVDDAFEPTLNHEHGEAAWARPDEPPAPLHPGVAATLAEVTLPPRAGAPAATDIAPAAEPAEAARDLGEDAAMRADRIAFDRKSLRRTDEDGHLHVERSNISAARINPYWGREIPDYERLGLDPNRTYKLYRHPDELAKAAETFNGKPLLNRHVPVSADAPQKNAVVGAINNVRFEDPFLVAELVVWDAEAIAGIESEEQRELSCGYRYVADMTPGEYNGEKYDGVMREISANHCALVPEGRAGADVVVADAALTAVEPIAGATKPKGQPMKLITRALPSRKALLVQGALSALLAPKLAADAKLDLSATLDGVTRTTFKAKKPAITRSLEKALEGKLAQDEGLGEVVEAVAELLDNLEGVQSGSPDDDDLSADEDETEEEKAAREAKEREAAGKDEDPAKILEDLKGKVSEETLAKVAAELKGGAADEPPATTENTGAGPDNGEAKDEDKVDQKAMDAAIARAKDDARRETIRHLGAIAAAKEAVRPHVGELPGAFDSAEDVYKFALDHAIEAGADIDLTGVPASAYAAMVKMLPTASAKEAKREPLAHDAKGAARAAEMFPGLARIGQA